MEGYYLQISTVIIVIKSRRIRWAGSCNTHGEIKKAYIIFVREPEGKDYLGDIGIDEKTILKCILK
jgi:hypothetical protein